MKSESKSMWEKKHYIAWDDTRQLAAHEFFSRLTFEQKRRGNSNIIKSSFAEK
jgi:hypothetical protein